MLGRIRKRLTQRAALDIYKTMVIPLMDYGDIFYDSGAKSLLSKLDSLQRRAVRVAMNLHRSECTKAVAKNLNIMELSTRRKLHLLQHARWLAGTGKYTDNRKLTTRAHLGNRRDQTIQVPKSSLYQNSFLYKSLNSWNSLAESFHDLKEEKAFKVMVKAELCSVEDVN